MAPPSTVGSSSFILTRRRLPDDLAYRLARALHQGRDVLGRRLPHQGDRRRQGDRGAPLLDLIYPGLQRYLREIGMLH